MGILLLSKSTIAGSFASKMGAGPFSSLSAPDSRGWLPARALNALTQSAEPEASAYQRSPGPLIAASRPQTSPRPPFITARGLSRCSLAAGKPKEEGWRRATSPPQVPGWGHCCALPCTPLQHPTAEVSSPAGLHGGALVPMQVVEKRGHGQAEEGAAAPTTCTGELWGQQRARTPTTTVTHV